MSVTAGMMAECPEQKAHVPFTSPLMMEAKQMNHRNWIKRLYRIAILFVVSACTLSQPIYAQTCFSGKPIDTCSWFFVTEMGVRVNKREVLPAFDRNSSTNMAVTAGFGAMKNLNKKYALGASLGFDPSSDDADFSLHVGPRIRYWMSDETSLDTSLSVGTQGSGWRSFTVQFILMYQDTIGISTGLLRESGRTGRNGREYFHSSETTPFVGARVGSTPGAIGIGAMAFLLTIVILTWDGGF